MLDSMESRDNCQNWSSLSESAGIQSWLIGLTPAAFQNGLSIPTNLILPHILFLHSLHTAQTPHVPFILHNEEKGRCRGRGLGVARKKKKSRKKQCGQRDDNRMNIFFCGEWEWSPNSVTRSKNNLANQVGQQFSSRTLWCSAVLALQLGTSRTTTTSH